MAENEVIDRAGDILAKKYGPLPFGAWLVIVGITAFAVRRVVKGKQDAAAAQAAANASGPSEGMVLDENGNLLPSAYKGSGGGLPFGSGSNFGTGSDLGTPSTGYTETNNESWLRRATEKLQKAGMWDTVTVQTALQRYISGGDLDQRQTAIVNQAITMEGQPPINVSPGKSDNTNVSVVGLVRPAGNAGIFVRYSDGTLTWIHDPNELQSIKQAYPNVNLTPVILPISDPIWRNADVYQRKSKTYLESEKANKADWHEPAFGPSSGTIYTI